MHEKRSEENARYFTNHGFRYVSPHRPQPGTRQTDTLYPLVYWSSRDELGLTERQRRALRLYRYGDEIISEVQVDVLVACPAEDSKGDKD